MFRSRATRGLAPGRIVNRVRPEAGQDAQTPTLALCDTDAAGHAAAWATRWRLVEKFGGIPWAARFSSPDPQMNSAVHNDLLRRFDRTVRARTQGAGRAGLRADKILYSPTMFSQAWFSRRRRACCSITCLTNTFNVGGTPVDDPRRLRGAAGAGRALAWPNRRSTRNSCVSPRRRPDDRHREVGPVRRRLPARP